MNDTRYKFSSTLPLTRVPKAKASKVSFNIGRNNFKLFRDSFTWSINAAYSQHLEPVDNKPVLFHGYYKEESHYKRSALRGVSLIRDTQDSYSTLILTIGKKDVEILCTDRQQALTNHKLLEDYVAGRILAPTQHQPAWSPRLKFINQRLLLRFGLIRYWFLSRFEKITSRKITPDDLVYLDSSVPSALDGLEETAWSSAVYSFSEDQLMAELSVAELFSQTDRFTVTINDSRQGSEPLHQADITQPDSAQA